MEIVQYFSDIQTVLSKQAANSFHWAPLFVICYGLGAVILFPSGVFTLMGGALFGAYLGSALNFMGSMLGAFLCYLVARHMPDSVRLQPIRRFLAKIGSIKPLRHSEFVQVLLLRLAPFVPYSAVNYGSGFARVPMKEYLTASAIGLIPKVVAGTFVGSVSREALASEIPALSDFRITVPLVLFVLIALITIGSERIGRWRSQS
ncbi:MAG: TVP38/TMEM64 family protein [Bdellovibrionales bacterium]|nr:TVP38/TMEM64 family protein [Bdellovibrionales bacterium]